MNVGWNMTVLGVMYLLIQECLLTFFYLDDLDYGDLLIKI